ncbi:MAG: hypothetical protein ACM3UR_14970 [Bacteroidota bacterium]|jgi:hypothetical protein|nr:hypothetical protein [Ignavibacteria bacterium]MCU7500206.1 hypothetical protein [Ignavibacteria bacterium]MCU7513866.1 hypothetical protein [Ignavibacteria bacterium]MCU7521544.1 hypothetical protein [Ignavibacteria bacterium]MCU7524998.1 hypothetical protein [Ignavibacteria bacterium]
MKSINVLLIAALMFMGSCLLAQENTKSPKHPKQPKKIHVVQDADSSDTIVEIPDIDIPEIHIPEIKVSIEKEKKILDELGPRLKKEMEKIKKLNKMKYNKLLMDNQFRSFEFPLFGKRSKEDSERLKKITELEIETEGLGLEYQKAEKAERGKIKSDLQAKLSDLFELREDNRKEEVKDLEDRLSELKQTLDERRKNKDKIISNRLDDLTGEDDNTEW